MVALPPVGRGALAGARERVLQRADQQAAHQARIAEAHLGLGGMHVDVDLVRVERDEQAPRSDDGRAAEHRRRRARTAPIRSLSRTGRPLTNRYCPSELARCERRQAGKALDQPTPSRSASTATALSRNSRAENVGEAREMSGRAGQCRRPGDRRALLAREREGDVGPAMARRRTTSRMASPSLRSLLRNFSRAGVAKKRSRTSTRVPSPSAPGFTAALSPPSTVIAQACGSPACRVVMVSRATAPIEGKRLAAEAERADVEQVVVGQLRGGVALDREREIVARHADAVVADADQPAAAAVGQNLDAGRAGIEGVLHQFLDDARRPLDHLARGDAVDDAF